MDIPNWIMDIHNLIMDIHNLIMDIHNCRVYISGLLAFHGTWNEKKSFVNMRLPLFSANMSTSMDVRFGWLIGTLSLR